MTDADWLAAVAAAPDDRLVRLVYADWLDDHGDPRAELLRLDVELTDRADGDPAAGPLRERLAELVPGTDARWRAAVCRVPLQYDGWVDHGGCMCSLTSHEAEELFVRVTPGYHVLQRQPATRTELEGLCAAARSCRGREIWYTGGDPVIMRTLADDPLLCRERPRWMQTPAVLNTPPARVSLWVHLLDANPPPLDDETRRPLEWIPVVLSTVAMAAVAVALARAAVQ